MARGEELLRLHALAPLLLQALLAMILPDLVHVVLPPMPPLLGVDGDFVPVPADLRPRIWPQRHGYQTRIETLKSTNKMNPKNYPKKSDKNSKKKRNIRREAPTDETHRSKMNG